MCSFSAAILNLRLVLVHDKLGVIAIANASHHYLQCKAFPTLTHVWASLAGPAAPYRMVQDNYKGAIGDNYGVMGHNHSHCAWLQCGAT